MNNKAKRIRGTKITRRQGTLLTKNGFDYNEWLLKSQDPKSYTYIHKESGQVMTLNFY